MARTRKGDSRNSPDGQPYVQGPGPAPDRGRWPVDPGASARPEGARPGSRPRRGVGIGMMLPLILAAVAAERSEEHTSELQSLMRISYAVFCLKKKKTNISQLEITLSYQL